MVVEMFHAIQKKGARNLSWWEDSTNADYLEKATVRFMNGMQGGKDIGQQKKKLVSSATALIFAFFKHNAFILD